VSRYKFRVDEPLPAALVAAGFRDAEALLALAGMPRRQRLQTVLLPFALRAAFAAATVPETTTTVAAQLVEDATSRSPASSKPSLGNPSPSRH
jgi:hypothetical protein